LTTRTSRTLNVWTWSPLCVHGRKLQALFLNAGARSTFSLESEQTVNESVAGMVANTFALSSSAGSSRGESAAFEVGHAIHCTDTVTRKARAAAVPLMSIQHQSQGEVLEFQSSGWKPSGSRQGPKRAAYAAIRRPNWHRSERCALGRYWMGWSVAMACSALP
jgi:hypothetical protein